MREGWRDVALADVVTATKGTTPTQKAVPGEYPLVVTAAQFASSDSYQFDGEAVCVPLVSSTGHGHASLKRVHYASGRFAVANIIAALEAVPSAELDMRYLWLLLDHGRDSIIVPLMKGTANVSLSIRSLLGARISLPPLPEQRRIVDLIGAIDDAIEKAEASAERAAVASRQHIAGLMGSEAEGWGTLGDAANWFSGSTPKAGDDSYYADGEVPWAVIGDVRDRPLSGTANHLTLAGASHAGPLAPPGAVLITMYGTIGRTALATVPMHTNQAIAWGVPVDGVSSEFLFAWARLIGPELDQLGRGATQRNINRAIVRGHRFPLMGAARQAQIVGTAGAWDAVVAEQQRSVAGLRSLREKSLSVLLSGEHAIPDSYDHLMEVAA